MKLHKLLMMALLVAGVTFAVGCGDNKNDSDGKSGKAEKAEKAENVSAARAAAEKFLKAENLMSECTFVKEIKVSDKYIVVCYNQKDEKGQSWKLGAQVVKKGDNWECADVDQDWDPRDEYK